MRRDIGSLQDDEELGGKAVMDEAADKGAPVRFIGEVT